MVKRLHLQFHILLHNWLVNIAPTALVARPAILKETAILPDGLETDGLANLKAAFVSERYGGHLGHVELATRSIACFCAEVDRVEI